MSFSDGRTDDALRDLIGWPLPPVPVTAAGRLADLRGLLADLRRRRGLRAPVWTKGWRP